ncbi:MAG: class I SAM-dependent methyltransferase [Cytophagales bacterium]
MEFLPEKIDLYCAEHSSDEDSLLKKISRETHLEVLMPRMLSGKLQGNFLTMISSLMKPKRILEIGTYTGYSALCLAKGLAPDGKIITIDINLELEDRVRSYFSSSVFANQIELLVGNATEIIPTLNEKFDLVFIDADKVNYSKYYELIFDKVNQNGLILADNVLWSGKVVEEVKENDKETKAIMAFNKMVQEDSRVENLLLPLRDGIMMARKL